ncbi:MAG: alpha/beta hydrolase [Lachnospiraceae bacterium]|nr:alpha/beta hydrolase [Lachnospiraceae bacterium]
MRIEIRDIGADGAENHVRLCSYILEASEELQVKDRPLILVCPGGGYSFTSDREADPVALQFNAMGFHSAILRYSVAPAEYPAALLEVGSSILHIRRNAKKWHVDPDRIILIGFSAGGHLACSYTCFYGEEFMTKKLGASADQLKVNGLILGYPVITSGEFAHRESIENLLGKQASDQSLWEKMSLENQITENMPRTFIWHTCEDDLVPVQNSLLLMEALIRKNIPVECHIFEKGGHGLSLCDWSTQDKDGFGIEENCRQWIPLVKAWLNYYLEEKRSDAVSND